MFVVQVRKSLAEIKPIAAHAYPAAESIIDPALTAELGSA
jgi:hypothetical protein